MYVHICFRFTTILCCFVFLIALGSCSHNVKVGYFHNSNFGLVYLKENVILAQYFYGHFSLEGKSTIIQTFFFLFVLLFKNSV